MLLLLTLVLGARLSRVSLCAVAGVQQGPDAPGRRVTLFAGAISASVLAGRVNLERPMGALPGLTLYSVVNFGLMLGLTVLGYTLAARWPRPATGPQTPAQ